MPNIDRIEGYAEELTAIRRDLHAHPEIGFEEVRTSGIVAEKLTQWGIEVHRGLGGTGVVGVLKGKGSGAKRIGLRADMDALPMEENTNLRWRSTIPGRFHGCGHDGHTTMLLGTARYLAETRNFDGTVRFIFQPAEEWGRGALAMLDDGLLQRFPFEEIFGLHNMPGLAVGHFETRVGSFMSAEDNFEIVLKGVGGHAARPHSGSETLVAACALVTALQTIVSRRLSPADIGVVSVTELITDGTRNALPGLARILGDARSFRPEVSAEIEKQMRSIAQGTAQAYNVSAEVTYTREFVPLVNDAAMVDEAFVTARSVLADAAVGVAAEPMTGSEDFARFLGHVPGCFVFLGNGNSAPLHNPSYDFNDEGLLHGARFHAAIARRRLPCV